MTELVLTNVTLVAGAVPKLTEVDPLIKPVPMIATDVPPAAGPETGSSR